MASSRHLKSRCKRNVSAKTNSDHILWYTKYLSAILPLEGGCRACLLCMLYNLSAHPTEHLPSAVRFQHERMEFWNLPVGLFCPTTDSCFKVKLNHLLTQATEKRKDSWNPASWRWDFIMDFCKIWLVSDLN